MRKPAVKITLEMKQGIINAFLCEVSKADIAINFNVSQNSVANIARKAGIVPKRYSVERTRRTTNTTEEERARITQLYESGHSTELIAKKYAVNIETVRRAVRSQGGIIIPKKALTQTDIQAIIISYIKGYTTTKIATAFNIAPCTAFQVLKKAGVCFRTRRHLIQPYKQQIISLYESGESLERLSQKFTFSAATISSLLQRSGVIIRTQKETTAINWQNPDYAHAVNSKRPDQRGEKSHRWRGGKTELSKLIRTSEQYKRWRKAVFTRDGFTCQQCGLSSSKVAGYSMQADHIYPFSRILDDYSIKTREQAMECEALWNINNGRTLCEDCHKATPTYGMNAQYYSEQAEKS